MASKKIGLLLPVVGIIFILLAAGCGASKSYVDQAVAEGQARSQAALDKVASDVATNKSELG